MSLPQFLEQQGRQIDLTKFPDTRGFFASGNPREQTTFGGKTIGEHKGAFLQEIDHNGDPDLGEPSTVKPMYIEDLNKKM